MRRGPGERMGGDRPAGGQVAGGSRAGRGRDPLRLLDTVRHYAAVGSPRPAAPPPGTGTRPRSWAWPSGNAGWRCWCASRTTSARRWNGPSSTGSQAGPRLARALGDFWLGRGLLQEGRDWLDRAVAQCPADLRLRADLLRLLGAALFEGGDLDRADSVLAEGSEVAAATGAAAVQARIAVLRADIRNLRGAGNAKALAECEAAVAVLESEGDLDGLAEALTAAGRLRFWLGDIPASHVVLERAITSARHSGNRRTQMRASHWLAVTFSLLAIPADAGVARAEQLLQDASGDLWAEADLLKPLCVLYAHVGRVADARAAVDRSQSIFTSFGAKARPGRKRRPGRHRGPDHRGPGLQPSATRGRDTRRGGSWEERGGYVVDLAVLLADALYEQGRFDEAQQMIDQVNAEPSAATVLQHAGDRGEAARPPRPVRRGPPASRPGGGPACRRRRLQCCGPKC